MKIEKQKFLCIHHFQWWKGAQAGILNFDHWGYIVVRKLFLLGICIYSICTFTLHFVPFLRLWTAFWREIFWLSFVTLPLRMPDFFFFVVKKTTTLLIFQNKGVAHSDHFSNLFWFAIAGLLAWVCTLRKLIFYFTLQRETTISIQPHYIKFVFPSLTGKRALIPTAIQVLVRFLAIQFAPETLKRVGSIRAR